MPIDKLNIKPLPNPACFNEILRAVNSARRSITVVNYIAEFQTDIVRAKPAPSIVEGSRTDDPVKALADALVHAKKRGVAASVVLEGSRLNDNYPLYRYLKDKGVDVWLDTSLTLVHHKAVLIDDRVLIAGSHNWSHAAFFKNEEFSIETNDNATVNVFKKTLERVVSQREEIRALKSKEFIKLPLQFINKIVLPLFSVHAEHAFNLYMLLVLEDGGRARPVPIDAEKWGAALGFDPEKAGRKVKAGYRKYYYAQRLNRVLGQLKRFGLIEVDRKKDTVVRLSLQTPVRHSERSEESRNVIRIPLEFWQHGWLSRLSFPAKAFYLVSILKTIDSPFYPWWSSSMKSLTKEFGIAHTIDDGVHELEDYNILEVLRAVPVKRGKFYSEEAHYYRLNPLYDMKILDLKLARLGKRFSKGVIEKSRLVAKTFWAAHNLESVEAISKLIDQKGWPKVLKAAKKISRLPASSSRRCLQYLEELLS